MGVHQEPRSQPTDQALANLVHGLDNLHWNLQVQAEILGLGERAVPALVSFLHGPPSQFHEGRVLAAEALGRLGGEVAFQGLLHALEVHPLETLNPVLRLSEEAVLNAVARQLARLGDQRAIPALLKALWTYHLLGAGEALVQLRELDALPWLVEGLEDAFKRERFAQVILDMGSAAIPYLADTLEQRRMRNGEELLPSLERRAMALKLLGLFSAKEAIDAIRAALSDSSDVVRMEAALALVAVKKDDGVLEAVPALLAGLTHLDFIQRDRCVDALVRIGPRCIRFIEQAIAEGGVMVAVEAVPLTVNARTAALAVLERLKGFVAC